MNYVIAFVFGLGMAVVFVSIGRWAYFHPAEFLRKVQGDLDFGNLAAMVRFVGVFFVVFGLLAGASFSCTVLLGPLNWRWGTTLALLIGLAVTIVGTRRFLRKHSGDSG